MSGWGWVDGIHRTYAVHLPYEGTKTKTVIYGGRADATDGPSQVPAGVCYLLVNLQMVEETTLHLSTREASKTGSTTRPK